MNWDPLARCTPAQRDLLLAFQEQLLAFNRRINLISALTAAEFEERHLMHVLALSYKAFPPGSTLVDWGTGGGLPAIPLAILFPESTVYAVDAVRKKIDVVRAMARRLGLENLEAWHGRAEAWPGSAHYSVSRATAPLATLYRWHSRSLDSAPPPVGQEHWPPGLICLKGGDLYMEIKDLESNYPDVQIDRIDLQPLLGAAYFAEKEILVVTK
jgi:16S rRNA (guanine527-N7)-methyltransferase